MSITAPKGPHGALGRQIANDLGLELLEMTYEEHEFAESSDDEDVYTVVLCVRAKSQEEADRKCAEAMSRDEKKYFFLVILICFFKHAGHECGARFACRRV